MKKRIFLFHMAPERVAEYQKTAAGLSAEAVTVPEAKWHCSMGHIVGIPGVSARAQKDTDAPITEEMLVLSGIDDATLDAFLAAVREAGIKPVRCKAILTPFNSSWSARALFAELQAEAASMK